MKHTVENIKGTVESYGLEPVQIDGIPEGFSYKFPDITIGKTTHYGHFLSFVPMAEVIVRGKDTEELLQNYNLAIKERDGKK